MCSLNIPSKPGVRRLSIELALILRVLWDPDSKLPGQLFEPRAVTPKLGNILLPAPTVPDLIN